MANKTPCKHCGWEQQDHINTSHLADQKAYLAQEGAEVALVDCDGFEPADDHRPQYGLEKLGHGPTC